MMVNWFNFWYKNNSLSLIIRVSRVFFYIMRDLGPHSFMPQRTLRFKIRQDGRVEETVEGLVGEACIDLTEKLEDALGTVERREPTSDNFLRENVQKQSIPAEIH